MFNRPNRPFQIPAQSATSQFAKAVNQRPTKVTKGYNSDGSDSDFEPESEGDDNRSCDTAADAFGRSDGEDGFDEDGDENGDDDEEDDDDDDDDDAKEYKIATRPEKKMKKAAKKQTVGRVTGTRKKGAQFAHTRKTDDLLREFMRNQPDGKALRTYFIEDFPVFAAGTVFENMFTPNGAMLRWCTVLRGKDPESIVYKNSGYGYTQEQRERIADYCAKLDGPDDPALWQWIVDTFPDKLQKRSNGCISTLRYQAQVVLQYINKAHKRGDLLWRPELQDQLYSISPPVAQQNSTTPAPVIVVSAAKKVARTKRAAPQADRPSLKKARVNVSARKSRKSPPIIIATNIDDNDNDNDNDDDVVIPFILDEEEVAETPVRRTLTLDELIASFNAPSHVDYDSDDEARVLDTYDYHVDLPSISSIRPPPKQSATRDAGREERQEAVRSRNTAKAVKYQSLLTLRYTLDCAECTVEEICVQHIFDNAHHTDLMIMLKYAGIPDAEIDTLDSIRASALVSHLVRSVPTNPLFELARSDEQMTLEIEEIPDIAPSRFAVDEYGSEDEYDLDDLIDDYRSSLVWPVEQIDPPATPAYFEHSVIFVGTRESDLMNGDILNGILDVTATTKSQRYGGKNINPNECREEYVLLFQTGQWYFVFSDRPYTAPIPFAGKY